MPYVSRLVLLVLAAAGSIPVASVSWAAAADLVAHRAVYDLKLESSHGGNVAAARGTMAYEMLDVCDGWATRQRLAMTVTNADGQDVQTLSDYTTYESKDGLKLRFRMRQTTDEAVQSEVEGDAELKPNGGEGTVHYTLPGDETKPLPSGTLFPTRHTEALLAAAEAGKKIIALPLFDGTTAKGAQDSSILITSWNGPKPSQYPSLAKLSSGRFHIAFFDRGPTASQPDYEVSMRYWDNGVADDLSMDFGDFVMAGKLREFKPVPTHGC